MVPGAEPEVLREYRHLLRTASADWQETAHRHALWALGPQGRGWLLTELQRLLLAGTRLGRDDVHALARLVVLAERRSPRILLDGLPRDLRDDLAAAVVGSPIGRMLRAGIDVWDGHDPDPRPNRRPTPTTTSAGSSSARPPVPRATCRCSSTRTAVRTADRRPLATAYGRRVTDIAADRARLLEIVRAKAIVHGRVTLSSGKEADYYVDLRRITLDGEASPLVGRVMRDLVADLDFDAVGGLTLGADPVATSMLHAAAAAGGRLDAFVVRKAGKAHGLQQRIEGPSIEGRRVLVVEDTSTTGRRRWMPRPPPRRPAPPWSPSPRSPTARPVPPRSSRMPGSSTATSSGSRTSASPERPP